MFDDMRIVHLIELAGWGGGPGMTMSVTLKGYMEVVRDPDTGLLVAECHEPIEAPEWVARALGVTQRVCKNPHANTSQQEWVWRVPRHQLIFFHPTHIRVMA